MYQITNKLREKLERGDTLTGTVLYSWSPAVVELAGLSGLDFVRIDTEHTWRQDATLEHLLRAAHLVGLMTIVRVDRDNPFLIRKALEIGAMGILVPDIHDATEAGEVIKAAKFPPKGNRGYSGQNWSGGWGVHAGKDWVEWSNSIPMIGIMIENPQAVKNIRDIVHLEGLDFIQFGPSDYSMCLGLGAPDKNHPEVQKAIALTLDAARKAQIPMVLGVGQKTAEIKKYKAMGVTMLELANDLAVLHSKWKELRDFVDKSK